MYSARIIGCDEEEQEEGERRGYEKPAEEVLPPVEARAAAALPAGRLSYPSSIVP